MAIEPPTLDRFPADSSHCLHLLIGLLGVEVNHGGRLVAMVGAWPQRIIGRGPAPEASFGVRASFPKVQISTTARSVVYGARSTSQLTCSHWKSGYCVRPKDVGDTPIPPDLLDQITPDQRIANRAANGAGDFHRQSVLHSVDPAPINAEEC